MMLSFGFAFTIAGAIVGAMLALFSDPSNATYRELIKRKMQSTPKPPINGPFTIREFEIVETLITLEATAKPIRVAMPRHSQIIGAGMSAERQTLLLVAICPATAGDAETRCFYLIPTDVVVASPGASSLRKVGGFYSSWVSKTVQIFEGPDNEAP